MDKGHTRLKRREMAETLAVYAGLQLKAAETCNEMAQRLESQQAAHDGLRTGVDEMHAKEVEELRTRIKRQRARITDLERMVEDAESRLQRQAELHAGAMSEVAAEGKVAPKKRLLPKKPPAVRYVVNRLGEHDGPCEGWECWDQHDMCRMNAWMVADHDGMTPERAHGFAQDYAAALNRNAQARYIVRASKTAGASGYIVWDAELETVAREVTVGPNQTDGDAKQVAETAARELNGEKTHD